MSQKRLLKCAVVAVVLLVATTILMAQVTTPNKPQPNAKPNAPASPVGRYQIVINPNVRADTFLLDTQTGQTWVQTEITDAAGSRSIWLFRERIDDDPAFIIWSMQHAKSDQK